MNQAYPRPVELIIASYCILYSGVLNSIWNGAIDRYMWLAFVIWSLPVIIFWVKQPSLPENINEKTTVPFFGVALLLNMLGLMSQFNALYFFSAAFALAGLAPFCWQMTPWFLLSICWMNIYRYFIAKFAIQYYIAIQLLTSILAVILHFRLVPYWRNLNEK